MQIRLIKKLADYLDGIDVSNYREGDAFDLPRREAQLLIAEGWAVAAFELPENENRANSVFGRAVAADEPARGMRTVEQLRRAREEMDAHRSYQRERRRVEDGIREELRDSRARTVIRHA